MPARRAPVTPTSTTDHSATRSAASGSVFAVLVIIGEVLAGVAGSFVSTSCFAIGFFQRKPDRAVARHSPETQAHPSQPGVGPELAIQPSPSEQTEEHADCQLEADRSVSSVAFPVGLHTWRE